MVGFLVMCTVGGTLWRAWSMYRIVLRIAITEECVPPILIRAKIGVLESGQHDSTYSPVSCGSEALCESGREFIRTSPLPSHVL